jgi:hypothetical protein
VGQGNGFYFGQPRFYGSPEAIRKQMAGIQKWKAEDVTKIYIEPQTGVVVRAQQLSQFSVGVVGETLT